GLDAMVLGNHEFDAGLDKLANFIANVNFPLLAANVDISAEPALADVTLLPYQLFKLEQQQLTPLAELPDVGREQLVAVFGLALEDMASITPLTGAVTFQSEIATAQRTVDELTALGVKHIIAVTHLGHQRDLLLAQAVNGIDVIVGGHSHSLLGDFRQWFKGQPGDYAQLITNADGLNYTCVVQAGEFAQAIGAVRLEFNVAGQLTRCEGENTILASNNFYQRPSRNAQSAVSETEQQQLAHFVDAMPNTSITAEHGALRQLLDTQYLPAVQQAYGAKIAEVEQPLQHVRLPGTGGSDQHGSILAGHVADGFYYWLNSAAVQEVTGKKVDFTLVGAGNIRSDLQAGDLYQGHIFLEVLPFAAPLSVVQVTGAELKALLLQVISDTLPEGAHAGKFPYSSHLRFSVIEHAAGQASFTQLQWRDKGQWHDIAPEQHYTLGVTSYLADGNDGWYLLAQAIARAGQRVDLVLQQGQPQAFKVQSMQPLQTANPTSAYRSLYTTVPALPCDPPLFDCRVAAQAVINYVQAHPEVLSQPRQPTVTLLR
ncbi:bifunctional metallophosphatase/5'-nucleotidase, partial [Arsukibacterium sp.]|uniref:bifunctional metallophosphatase/5'-nucleotidase n=1 Tax=Arsukibacterium sp. TaxID=1977258 RepID=UPI002FD9FE2E